MKKYIFLLFLIICTACNKEIKKDIAYIDEFSNESKIICNITNDEALNGYRLEEIQEFTYNDMNYLETANIKINMDLLTEDAKVKLNSVINNYIEMAYMVNDDINNQYQGMNMNVYSNNDRFEVSIYYDINHLNKEYIDNIEFKKYLNNNGIFDIDNYKKDYTSNGWICSLQ